MKRCLIVVNTYKDESRTLGQEMAEFLKLRGVNSSFFCFDGFCTENPFFGSDFVITLGGDGTVLFAARGCAESGIPVFPVNLGEFGFIASVQKDDWKAPLAEFLDGAAAFEERSMLQAALSEGRGREEPLGAGLNDVVVCAGTAARTVLLDISYNGMSLGTMKGDGVIVSTATGSTAYSASAGGPIIDPELDAFVLTPINAFSLSCRPLVLNPRGEIGIRILPSREQDTILTIDGQKPLVLKADDCVKISRLAAKVKLIGCTTEKFYGALCSKLNWSGGPHA